MRYAGNAGNAKVAVDVCDECAGRGGDGEVSVCHVTNKDLHSAYYLRDIAMPAAKDRQFRLAIIDEAIRGATENGRPISKEELIQHVQERMEFRGMTCSRSSVEHDLTYIKKEFLESVTIEDVRVNGRAHYRYTERGMSIKRGMLNQDQFRTLDNAFNLMEQWRGFEGYELVEDLVPQLRSRFQSSGRYIENFLLDYSDALGRTHIRSLAEFIREESVLQVEYEEFDGEQSQFIYHPHILKEYNGRWYCFGYNQSTDKWKFKVALDRIKRVREVRAADRDNWPDMDWAFRSQSFDDDEVMSWKDYFTHFMGPNVNRTEAGELEDPIAVQLRFRKSRVGYVVTKPLHGTQQPHTEWPEPDSDGWYSFEYAIVPTKEFYSRLLEFGEDMEVVAPMSVRNEMRRRIDFMARMYADGTDPF